MPKPKKLRETMRQTPSKSPDVDSSNTGSSDALRPVLSNSTGDNMSVRHSRSVSTNSIMPGGNGDKNPWDDEVSASSPIRPPHGMDADERGRQQGLEVPDSQRSERSVSEKPTARRRKKTLNQVTPHRFELIDAKRDSMLAKPTIIPVSSRPVTPTEQLVIPKTRAVETSAQPTPAPIPQKLSFSQQKPVAVSAPIAPVPQRRMFSRIRIFANITPIEPPRPPSPRISPPDSPIRTNGSKYDFIGDFGMGRNDTNAPFTSSPVTSSRPPQTSPRPISYQNTTTQPFIYRPPSDPLPTNSLLNKVVVVTNGTSTISSPLVRTLHRAGARVIFSAPADHADKARSFIRSLGPPDTLHFNACDLASYSSMHALFKLGITMYGRIDHAIFAPGDDGGQARGVGAGERHWGLDTGLAEGRTMTTKAEFEAVERGEASDPSSSSTVSDVVGAGVRFARIAVGYLRNSPGRKQRHATGDNLTPTSAGGFADSTWSEDRSLTFVSSTAALTPIPYLPVYTASQHAILGIVRSLGASMSAARDGVRVNMVATNMLVPSVVEAKGGGRMSVQLPSERGEDIALIVAGVMSNRSRNRYGNEGEEVSLHGRVLYAMGAEAVDVQEGLDASEGNWLGGRGKEALDVAMGRTLDGGGAGGKGRWMLMDGVDS